MIFSLISDVRSGMLRDGRKRGGGECLFIRNSIEDDDDDRHAPTRSTLSEVGGFST